MKNAEIFNDAKIYTGDKNKYDKINRYYDVKTILKKSLYEQMQEGKRTSDVDKSEGWAYGDIRKFLTSNADILFPKIDDVLYQIDFLLPAGWRSSLLFPNASEIEFYDSHTTESSANVESQIIYGVSLKRLHTNVK